MHRALLLPEIQERILEHLDYTFSATISAFARTSQAFFKTGMTVLWQYCDAGYLAMAIPREHRRIEIRGPINAVIVLRDPERTGGLDWLGMRFMTYAQGLLSLSVDFGAAHKPLRGDGDELDSDVFDNDQPLLPVIHPRLFQAWIESSSKKMTLFCRVRKMAVEWSPAASSQTVCALVQHSSPELLTFTASSGHTSNSKLIKGLGTCLGQIVTICPEIGHLDLVVNHTAPDRAYFDIVNGLASWSALTTIRFWRLLITHSMLEALSSSSNLREISIKASAVTLPNGPKHVMLALRTLRISDVEALGICALLEAIHAPQLENAEVDYADVSNDERQPIRHLPDFICSLDSYQNLESILLDLSSSVSDQKSMMEAKIVSKSTLPSLRIFGLECSALRVPWDHGITAIARASPALEFLAVPAAIMTWETLLIVLELCPRLRDTTVSVDITSMIPPIPPTASRCMNQSLSELKLSWWQHATESFDVAAIAKLLRYACPQTRYECSWQPELANRQRLETVVSVFNYLKDLKQI